MATFDPTVATLGGMSLPLVHLNVMSQLARMTALRRASQTSRWSGWLLDLCNYPIAAVELLLIVPPWPLYSSAAWTLYLGAIMGTATAAGATAKRILSQES